MFHFRDKKSLSAPILSSMTRLMANHIGSAALGSFIIILVKIPRCILMYIYRQIKDNVSGKYVSYICLAISRSSVKVMFDITR